MIDITPDSTESSCLEDHLARQETHLVIPARDFHAISQAPLQDPRTSFSTRGSFRFRVSHAFFSGAHDGDRTCDLSLRRQLKPFLRCPVWSFFVC
jgi:hypothetical protein